jgi:hypothetical protein
MEDKKECLGWLQDDDKCETSTSDFGGEDTALEIINCDDNAKSTGMLIQSPSGHKAMIYCKETLPRSLSASMPKTILLAYSVPPSFER